MTTRRCVVKSETGEYLGDDARLTCIDRNAVRAINGREEHDDNDEQMTLQQYNARLLRGNDEESNESAQSVVMSTNVMAQLACHAISSASRNHSFSIERREGENKLCVIDKEKRVNWANSEDLVNQESQKRIGSLSVAAICKVGSGIQYVRKEFALDRNRVRMTEKETDTFLGNDLLSYEIKGRGQLGMAKPLFFKSRLIELVSKAYFSQSTGCVVLVRDDRELDGAAEKIKPMEVLFWSDVQRLLPQSFFNAMKTFQADLDKVLYSPTAFPHIKEIEAKSDGVHFKIKPSIEGKVSRAPSVKLNETPFIPRNFRYTPNDKVKPHYVVVGRGIPAFEYNLSDVFLRYKFQHSWKIQDTCERMIILVENNVGLKETLQYFQPFTQRKQKLQVLVFIKTEVDKESKKIINDYLRDENVYQTEFRRFNDFNNLGDQLHAMGVTIFNRPIPKILLLLGQTARVPLRLSIARLDFIDIDKARSFDFSVLRVPAVVAAIGSLRECLELQTISKQNFPNIAFRAFVVGDASTADLPACYIRCRESEIDNVMKRNSFPVYNSFALVKDHWVAQ